MDLDPNTNTWQAVVASEFQRRRDLEGGASNLLFPLAANPFGVEEIVAMTDVLLSGRLTLGAQVDAAEKAFAKKVGTPYAIMVNSGSSANLLMVAAIVNKFRPVHCSAGDEVLVPAVCWSTSVHPLLQSGLKPVFVDVDPLTFNTTLELLESKMNPRVRAVMAVHVLGNCINMKHLEQFVRKHGLILIEDTCESLGTFVQGEVEGQSPPRMLGTVGDFGAFSFYFSHHITSGEGGMVCCKTEEDYNFVRCLRAHGWTRHLTNRAEVEARYPDIDSRFVFVNVGFNLRPLEVQGAMLRVQLDKLEQFNECRRDNLRRIHARLSRDARFAQTMALMRASEGTDPAWFGIGAMLHQPFSHQLRDYLVYLEANGVENRPIISGNFIRQPCIAAYCENERAEDYLGAEAVHNRGFFIGVHQLRVADDVIDKLADIMLSFPFVGQHIVLVTGSNGMLGRHVRQLVEQLEHTKTGEDELVVRSTNSKWVFVTRQAADLCDLQSVRALFKKHTPTQVLHCAGKLASIKQMTERPVDFWLENVAMNNNVLQVAHESKARTGPVKVVCVLSTVLFPRDAQFPVTVRDLHSGPPPPQSESYAFAKRALDQLTKWYRAQHQANFVSVLPGNFYGAFGDFNPATAPLVNSLIAKAELAHKRGDDSFKVMGTGKPYRQLMWAGDLAKVLLWALDHLDQDDPLIACGPEVTIEQVAQAVCRAVGFQGQLAFDVDGVDGPLKRTADNSVFEQLCQDLHPVSLEEGIATTVRWYRDSQVA